MVDMYVRRNQRLDRINFKADFELRGSGGAVGRGLRPLKQSAINEQAVALIEYQLMTGTGDAFASAMMNDFYVHDVIVTIMVPMATGR